LRRVVKRTKGVSTTDLVGRMLLLTKTHWVKKDKSGNYNLEPKKLEVEASPPLLLSFLSSSSLLQEFSISSNEKSTRVSNFYATAGKIVQFSSGKEAKVCFVSS